jgi:hypothetical protein
MSLGQDAKDPKHSSPNADEEKHDKENDLPPMRMFAGPEIQPVSAVWSRQPIVLNKDRVKKPLYHHELDKKRKLFQWNIPELFCAERAIYRIMAPCQGLVCNSLAAPDIWPYRLSTGGQQYLIQYQSTAWGWNLPS